MALFGLYVFREGTKGHTSQYPSRFYGSITTICTTEYY